MHRTSFDEMRAVLDRHLAGRRAAALDVLDVGSLLVPESLQRTYRELMSPQWRYTGADIAAGPNVDMVMAEYGIPAPDGAYDVVISGQCLEHVREPWKLVPEMARVLAAGGLMVLTAPFQWAEHRFPLDCWRLLPDGMRVLFDLAGLTTVEAYINGRDCWGIARKSERGHE